MGSGFGVAEEMHLAKIAKYAIPAMADAAAGRTRGAADVSASGEAQYSIPIFTPPGTNGMHPNLALVYGHRSKGGWLGVGWSIAGLSAITRCHSTWAADNVARNVQNSYADRFCLDGNKLRLTSASGTYGHPGATYRTEVETFSRITSYGTAGNGPEYFYVEHKDGLIYEYGATAASRIKSLSQTTVHTWALSKIRDRSGNSIVFDYEQEGGGYRIRTIEYTSNPGEGLAAEYVVSFTYEDKPLAELKNRYVAGSPISDPTGRLFKPILVRT